MAYAIQWIRSVLFNIQMYIFLAIWGTALAIPSMFSIKIAYFTTIGYCKYIRWSAAWMVGLKSETRGTPPKGELIIAAKHMSFFDVLHIVSEIDSPKFIMKASISYMPVVGWYGKMVGCVPVNRGKRAEAIRKMVADVTAGNAPAGQLIIYPQGTRVAPGAKNPYKVGAAVLYKETGQTVIPVATNIGVFWPRFGIYRKPGTAIIEFLDPIPPGLSKDEFMARLEDVIETNSNRLMREAGFDPDAVA